MTMPWLGNVDVGCYDLESVTSLDPARTTAFRRYLAQEYEGGYKPDQGAYEILDMVRRLVPPGRRLDVGGGTASLFWILSAAGPVLTTASDVEPEALAVLRDFLSRPEPLPACYYQAARLFSVTPSQVDQLRRSIDSFLIFNALGPWPAEVVSTQVDSVTAFGCFAISGSAAGYEDCFGNAALAVRPGGRIIGADWIRHRRLQRRDYSFITEEDLAAIGARLELRVLHLRQVPVRGDGTYENVVLWAFERPALALP